jgi:hypothetical protein
MRQAGLAHEHRSLHFRVRADDGTTAEFTPAVVARRGTILFLVEPLSGGSSDREMLQLLARFLETHSPEIVLILVTTEPDVSRLPPGAYDEAYAAADIARVVRRIKGQDPRGLILPFRKPASAPSPERDSGSDR